MNIDSPFECVPISPPWATASSKGANPLAPEEAGANPLAPEEAGANRLSARVVSADRSGLADWLTGVDWPTG
eukprot:5362813-Pyramimonas_sp.AAC.2